MIFPYILVIPFLLLIFIAYTSNNTSAPFKSDMVKEIWSHMSLEEKRKFTRQSAKFGAIGGLLIGVGGPLGGFILKWVFSLDSYLMGMLAIQPLLWALIGILYWKVKPKMEQSQKEHFASTQWAKEQGLTTNQITLR